MHNCCARILIFLFSKWQNCLTFSFRWIYYYLSNSCMPTSSRKISIACQNPSRGTTPFTRWFFFCCNLTNWFQFVIQGWEKIEFKKSRTSYWFKAKLFIIIFSITKVQRVWNRYIYFLKVSIIYGAYNNVRSKSSIVTELDIFWIWPLPLDLLYKVLDFYNLTLTLNFLAWV